jgi:UDP-N-acetylglucosamine 2-epimerase (non-hydrolysing)
MITIVLGTRPEAIKLAPLVLKLRQACLPCRVCATGQHRELAGEVLADFDIVPETTLEVMEPDQTLAGLTSRLLGALDCEFRLNRPAIVIVQGDTTSAFTGALAAFYHGIPVAHVEAGLRTGNLAAPWPEEGNRTLISRLAELHFAPTEQAQRNLLSEGIGPDRIHVTGNTAIDALLWMREKLRSQQGKCDVPAPTVMITAHRREHFGERLRAVCEAIADLAERFPMVRFVYSVHPNPNVRAPVDAALRNAADSRLRHGNVHLIAPLGYRAFVGMLDSCMLILTDSGGIQEEAPSLGKPVIVLRDATERPEALRAGAAVLVGTDRGRIVSETSRLLSDHTARQAMTACTNPFGDGNACERILDVLKAWRPIASA